MVVYVFAAENGKCFYHLNVLLTLFLPPGAFDPISITKVFILSIFVFFMTRKFVPRFAIHFVMYGRPHSTEES